MEKFITPVCKTKYLWIFKPNAKFEPCYSITCIVEDSHEWNGLIGDLTSLYDAYYDSQCQLTRKKLKKCPYLPWKTDESGLRTFTAKNGVKGTKKDGTTFEIKIHICGPDREELKERDLKGMLATGTEAAVGFTANLWANDAQGVGLSARLNVVQIVKPVYAERFAGYDSMKTFARDDSLFNSRTKVVTDDDNDGLDIHDLFAGASEG